MNICYIDMDDSTLANQSNDNTTTSCSSVISTLSITPPTVTNNTVSASNRRITRGNSGANVSSTYMKRQTGSTPPSPVRTSVYITPVTSPVEVELKAGEETSLTSLQHQIASQQNHIRSLELALQHRDTMFTRINQRLDLLEKETMQTRTMLHVKDVVIDRLRSEVTKLQQYTRRYSVVISGIEKKEKNESLDYLKAEIEKVVKDVDSGITMEDVDKFHRNGPYKDGNQEVIVRFKAHSNKEAFYRGRKTMKNKAIKIRPSLTDNNKKLLNEAREYLDTFYNESSELSNPPHLVMANIHGQIQLKIFLARVGMHGSCIA